MGGMDMAELGSIPKFNGLTPFKPDDLPGNFQKLMDSALIGRENQVMTCIKSFTISGKTTAVVKDKCKSALFVAYLTYLRHNMIADYQSGKPVEMSDYCRELVLLYFGEEFMDHEVPTDLMELNAIIQIEWKLAA